MLDELLTTPGVTEHSRLRSSVGFMALHGGLEDGTFEIADAAAAESGASFYGVLQPPDLSWHVPSHRYATEQSPALAEFCDRVEVAISVHGYGGVRDSPHRWLTILLGGGGRAQAAVVAAELRTRLLDYVVLDDLEEMPRQYRGVHPDNPVNRVRAGGVQIELPPRVRGTSPIWADHDFERSPMVPHTRALVDGLVAAAEELAS